MAKMIILPSCDDGNRGDQALVWQTHELAKAVGLADECKMLTDDVDNSPQSQEEGIGVILPILRHPSTKFSPKSNLSYGKLLFVIWGLISILDGIRAFLLLFAPTRFVVSRFLTSEERETIKEIRTADACFVKGGGFIHTTNSVSDPYRAFYFLFHVMLAHSLKTPVYVMPNSFGPLKGALYQAIVRYTLNRCEIVTARESISQNMLAAIGVKSSLYPDLAFGLKSKNIETSFFEDLRSSNSGRRLVGITARPYRFPSSANPVAAYQKYLKEMASFARTLYAEGYMPVFVEHVISGGEHESDISAIEDITKLLSLGEFAIFSDDTLNARQMKSVYGKCDFVVGTRFHSVIFALAEGVPALAIGYGGNKGKGIMADIGLPNNVIAIDDFDVEQAKTKFLELVENVDAETFLGSLNAKITRQHEDLLKEIQCGLK